MADLSTPEMAAVLSAIDAQVATVRTALADGNLAAAQATAALLSTHVAELNTLVSGGTSGTTTTGTTTGTTTTPVTTGVALSANPEVSAILSAIDAQVASIRTSVASDSAAAAQATVALLNTHLSELSVILAAAQAS